MKKGEKKKIEINESMFYDKYFVIKKSKAKQLAEEAINELSEEGKVNEHGVIEIVDILERVDDIQGAEYFSMNLDEESSIKAMQTYYHHKYGAEAAKACIDYILKGEVGKKLVFKGKTLISGTVVDIWRHPDGGKVFEIEDKSGNKHTVPEDWIVKWLEE